MGKTKYELSFTDFHEMYIVVAYTFSYTTYQLYFTSIYNLPIAVLCLVRDYFAHIKSQKIEMEDL